MLVVRVKSLVAMRLYKVIGKSSYIVEGRELTADTIEDKCGKYFRVPEEDFRNGEVEILGVKLPVKILNKVSIQPNDFVMYEGRLLEVLNYYNRDRYEVRGYEDFMGEKTDEPKYQMIPITKLVRNARKMTAEEVIDYVKKEIKLNGKDKFNR